MLVPARLIPMHIDCSTSILNNVKDIVGYKSGSAHIVFFGVICLFELH
jgi:hypothetical protein